MKRLQRKRAKGWRKPEGSVIVDRTSKFGNPFKVETHDVGSIVVFRVMDTRTGEPVNDMSWGSRRNATEYACDLYYRYALHKIQHNPNWLEPLRGKDLLCFCPEGEPCHADVLIELCQESE